MGKLYYSRKGTENRKIKAVRKTNEKVRLDLTIDNNIRLV